jgi:GTPase SAR1 family protein
MDKLRADGVGEVISLPELVVCGDQSSGKSSVLEAITEIPFPRNDSICTRFATQIVLRRLPESKVVVNIILDKDQQRSRGRNAGLAFNRTITNFNELPSLVKSAEQAMGISWPSNSFSKDILRIEISGPDRPHLTVVDLPGLIHTENKAQSSADVKLVSEMVESFMQSPRTIILAVVTAKNDYANQIVLKRAKEADPDGRRTLGIITKPDTLPSGSESERDFAGLAQNEDIVFHLGWHVLRNRNYEERNNSFQERNETEEQFFKKGIWKNFPREHVGVVALRSRLSSLLYSHIVGELPGMYKKIKNDLEDCEAKSSKFGGKRDTLHEQRVYLSEISQNFNILCKNSVDGIYESTFFGTGLSENSLYERRLRAVVQNSNDSFAAEVRTKGYKREILEEGLEKTSDEQMTEEEAIAWVKPLILESRGRELPGTFNPMLISNLFWEQSEPWEKIARGHINLIFEACQRFLHSLLPTLANQKVSDAIFACWLDEAMDKRLASAKIELENLLNDRRRHCVTYNQYFTETVHKIRGDRRFHSNYSYPSFDSNAFLDNASSSYPPDNMVEYLCLEALDFMMAYYKVYTLNPPRLSDFGFKLFSRLPPKPL